MYFHFFKLMPGQDEGVSRTVPAAATKVMAVAVMDNGSMTGSEIWVLFRFNDNN
jgi:hypothetical protein